MVINAIGNRRKHQFNQLLDELKGISPTTLAETGMLKNSSRL